MTTIPHRVPISRRQAPNPAALLIATTPSPAADDRDAETPGVLLLDGPPGTAFVWHQVLPVLRCCGVQPSTVKRPGHLEALADPFEAAGDIAQLLGDERHPPAVVVAHGLDIGVAIALAAAAPHHVRALVLVGPAGGLPSISIVDRLLAAPMIGAVVTGLGFRVAGLALHLPALRRRVLIGRAGVDAGDAQALVREITFGTLWRDFLREERRLVGDARRGIRQLAGIDCPVLIIVGQDDRTVAHRTTRALRRLLPAAEVVDTAAAPYQIPIEDPDCVVDAVLLALRRDYRASLSARRAAG